MEWAPGWLARVMSEQLRESLSAVMDGEANAFEVRRVLDEVRRDAELRKVWNRWQLVSAALHNDVVPAGPDRADRVWAGLSDASAADSPVRQAGPGHRWNARRLTAWAAVSAVALAMVAATYLATFGGDRAPVALPESAARPTDLDPPVALPGQLPSEARNVDVYLLHHMQQKAAKQPDVGVFAKLVTFERE